MTDTIRLARLLPILTASIALLAPTHAAEAPKDTSQFDRAQALRISQGAIGGTVSDYTFTDRYGRSLHLGQFRGKPMVISLVYSSCYHICPTTTRHLAKVVEIARDALGEDSFNVATIGFDTPNDTPDAMRVFAAQQGVDIDNWHFLSADRETITKLSADLGFIYFPSAKGFDHLIQASVIDGDGRVYRQVYGMNFETPLLVEPLKELVYGTPKEHSLLSFLGDRIRLFCTVYDPSADRYYFDYSLFIGMAIGAAAIGGVIIFLVREWRRARRRDLT